MQILQQKLETYSEFLGSLTLASEQGIQTATMMHLLETMMGLVHDTKKRIYFVLEQVPFTEINPLSYSENEGGHFFSLRPPFLVQTINHMSRTARKIVEKDRQLIYTPDNPCMTSVDCLVHYAAHEVRHTLQGSSKLFTPKSQEKRRGYLGLSLDINKQRLSAEPGDFSQSGKANIGREFDAEVIAMYIANLWQEKNEDQIRAMLLTEPDAQ